MGNCTPPPQFVILTFTGNNEEFWKPELEVKGIKVINIEELIGVENVVDEEFGYFALGHPKGILWEQLIPKLKELYPDL